MEQLIQMIQLMAMPIDDETRQKLIQQFYYVARGSMHSILAVLDNEPRESTNYVMARDNLQALHGFLTEQLAKYGETPAIDVGGRR